MMKRLIFLGTLGAVLLVAAACGGGDDSNGDDAPTPASGLVAQVVSQDVAVGPNRFAVGLFDDEAGIITGADASFRFFKAEGESEVAAGDATARYVGLKSGFVHEHPDGAQHPHTGDEVGLYIADAEFDSSGVWEVEVRATVGGEERGPARAAFQVAQESAAPAIGDPAPATRQTTLADVAGIAEVDTSAEPILEMHQLTIADAVASGRPTVIVFATPAFCTSRLCGPVKEEVVDPLFPDYRDRVNFVHVEPYDIAAAREGSLQPIAAMAEWRLQTEPWVFVVDAEARIAARFEGVLSQEELRQALDALVG